MPTTERGSLLILSGPSGAGKTTVINKLKEIRGNIYFSVSCTTRAPREGEKHGVNYYYISDADFKKMVSENGFLEHAGYVGHYYGTPLAPIEEHLAAGDDVILDIEVQGAMQVHEHRPDAILCFIIPPSFKELSRRLCGRGTESPEVIQNRLARAKEEYQHIPEYEYLVINDIPENAAAELAAILDADKCRFARRINYVEEQL